MISSPYFSICLSLSLTIREFTSKRNILSRATDFPRRISLFY